MPRNTTFQDAAQQEATSPIHFESSSLNINTPTKKYHQPVRTRKISPTLSTHELVQGVCKRRPSREEPLFICNLSKVDQQIAFFRRCLPRVTPFFAVKCNPHPRLLQRLNQLGVSYDCASLQEMKLLGDVIFNQQDQIVEPSAQEQFYANKVIFANPCKQIKHIQYAKKSGVEMIVVDNINEVHKMAKHYPEAKLVIRIKVDDTYSKCKFSIKFGADLEDCPKMLQTGKEYGLNFVGVSFHVGSGCENAESYIHALKRAQKVGEMMKDHGFELNILDIGGGMPGTEEDATISFQEIANTIRGPLDEMFDPETVRVIAEPGRYVATQPYTLVVNVFSKKEVHTKDEATRFIYYINDSLYGSLNALVWDFQKPAIKIVKDFPDDAKLYNSTVFGATCDSVDMVFRDVKLPELDEGDWLYFENFGAYTIASSSAFNGFSVKNYSYVEEEEREEPC